MELTADLDISWRTTPAILEAIIQLVRLEAVDNEKLKVLEKNITDIYNEHQKLIKSKTKLNKMEYYISLSLKKKDYNDIEVIINKSCKNGRINDVFFGEDLDNIEMGKKIINLIEKNNNDYIRARENKLKEIYGGNYQQFSRDDWIKLTRWLTLDLYKPGDLFECNNKFIKIIETEILSNPEHSGTLFIDNMELSHIQLCLMRWLEWGQRFLNIVEDAYDKNSIEFLREIGDGESIMDKYGLSPTNDGFERNSMTGEVMDPIQAKEHRRMCDLQDGIADDN